MRHRSLSPRRSASDARAHATLMLRPHGAVPNWSGLNKTIRTLSVLRLGDTMVRLRGDTKGLWKGFVRRVCCALPLKCVFLLSSQKCVLHLWSLTGGRERKKKKSGLCPLPFVHRVARWRMRVVPTDILSKGITVIWIQFILSLCHPSGSFQDGWTDWSHAHLHPFTILTPLVHPRLNFLSRTCKLFIYSFIYFKKCSSLLKR